MSKYGIPGLDSIRAKAPSLTARDSSVAATVDEHDPVYIQSMTKLYDAAWKFDREKNGDLLKASLLSFLSLLSEQRRSGIALFVSSRISSLSLQSSAVSRYITVPIAPLFVLVFVCSLLFYLGD
jgi:hypothetical protein